MVYSMDRLRHAYEVFHESESYRARRGLNADYLGVHFRKYNLRNLTAPAAGSSLWDEDSDNDDEYDPVKHKTAATRSRLSRSQVHRKGPDANTGTAAVNGRTSTGNGGGNTSDQKESGQKVSELPFAFSWNNPPLTPGQHAVRKAALRKAYDTAKPDDDFASTRLRNGKVPVSRPKPWRRGCEACKEVKRRCHQTSKSNKPSCGRCLKEGVFCLIKSGEGGDEASKGNSAEFGDPPTNDLKQHDERGFSSLASNGDSANIAIVVDSPPISPTIDLTRVSGTRAKRINTYWVHPIDYVYYPSRDPERRPCHFCNDFRYGIYGCGQAEIDVIQHPGSLKYDERGPPRQHEPTRMCLACALERIHISKCPKHNLVRLVNPDPSTLDLQTWIDRLHDRSASRTRKAVHPCCSLCLYPAVYFCCSPPHTLTFNGILGKPCEVKKRCKLFLCQPCRGLVELYGMQKRALEVAIQEERVARELRADMEFLFPHSDLHKAWKT